MTPDSDNVETFSYSTIAYYIFLFEQILSKDKESPSDKRISNQSDHNNFFLDLYNNSCKYNMICI